MPYNYTDLKGTDKIKDMYPKVNEIGNYLKNNVNPTTVPIINGVDFNNILASIPDTGFYYVTLATNTPTGVSTAGYVQLQRRTGNYHRITFMPYNLNTMYIKICNNGVMSDWEKVQLAEGAYTFGKTLDVKTLKETTTQYATVLNPPSPELNEGWVDFSYGKNNLGIAEFNPINSESTFKKMQKLQTQTQNPNLLEDATFKNTIVPMDSIQSLNDTPKWEQYVTLESMHNPVPTRTFQGQNMVVVQSNGKHQYPSVISKPYEIGKDIKVGDTITFSVYAMVPDTKTITDRKPYIDIACYDNIIQNTNPTIGQYEMTVDNTKSGEWKKISVTTKVPATNIEGKPCKYLRVLLRLNCSKNTAVGADVYYALPKLEKSSTPTPFISNTKDTYQYDEIWTQWLEYPDVNKLNRYVPSDMTTNGFFDFLWDGKAQAGKTFQDLVNTVPQGLHTFYCNQVIEGSPSNVSPVRGTILIDHIGGSDITQPTRGVIQCIDNKGKMYVYYKHDNEITQTSQLQGSTFLWEGTLDLSETNKTVTLADDPTNYDYIEATYYHNFGGGDFVHKQSMAKGGTNLIIRNVNISDTGGNGLDIWEGGVAMNGKSMTPVRSARLYYNPTKSAFEPKPLNTKGEMILYKVVGIRSI